MGGTVTWPQKHRKHRAPKAPKKISFGLHWNWGWGGPSLGDPPPPKWGDRPDLRGGGVTRGAGGSPDQPRPSAPPHSSTAGMGVSTWMHPANSEGGCPPPCGPDTEQ